MTMQERIMSTTFSSKDLKDDNLLAAEDSAEELYDHDIEDCLEAYYSDWELDEVNAIDCPCVFVYQKTKPFRLTAEDVMNYFEQSQCEQDCDNFEYAEVDRLLEPLNVYLASISNTYVCVGRIKDADVKPIWEKLKKEWNEG